MTLLLFGSDALAQESTKLSIQISNLKNSEGLAVVNLFPEQDDIPKKPFKSLKAVIKNGKAEILFCDLPPGGYAVITYHDKNSNGILDHKPGFPNEPMGFFKQLETGVIFRNANIQEIAAGD